MPASGPPEELVLEPLEPLEDEPELEPLDARPPSPPDEPDDPLAPELAPDEEGPPELDGPPDSLAVAQARLAMLKTQIAGRKQRGRNASMLFTTLFWSICQIASAQESDEGSPAGPY
jgi:hypothetical protein